LPANGRFCGHCGLSIEPGAGGVIAPGRLRDPRSAPVPPGLAPVEDAAGLYFRWESSLGGQPLIETEGLQVEVFNASYGLTDVHLRLTGEGRDSAAVLDLSREISALPKGGRVRLDVPSYEVREELRRLRVRLVSAAFERAAGG
jgi:hypothetical protein